MQSHLQTGAAGAGRSTSPADKAKMKLVRRLSVITEYVGIGLS